jgi:hypothetical protein
MSSKIAICMPIRDRVEPETEFALKQNVGFAYELLTEVGLPVDEARNRLTERALAGGSEQIVWADADAFWVRGSLERMLSWTTDPSKIIGTVHGRRMHFSAPAAYESADLTSPVRFDVIRSTDGIIPCHFIGSHVLACSRSFLERLGPSPWALDEGDGSEDCALARRTIVAGCSMYLDTRVWTFHVENGIMYVPGSSAYALVDGKPEKRPIAPTAPFAEPRNYGPKVDAARRESTGLSDADVPRAKAEWMALVKAKVATDPLIATRFRAPTEEELASVSLGGIRMAPNTRSAGRPSVAPA